jgi:DNA-binding NarL/FixJ family response regulator
LDVVRVAVVEDLPEIREGLATLIGATPGFACSGTYATAELAVRGLPENVPDVVLMDLGLPRMSGVEAIGILKERLPQVVFLVLTVYEDDFRIFDALCAGASGYLLKKTAPDRLMEALREGAQGGGPLSPEIARKVIALFRHARPPLLAEHDVTPHEVRILRMLADGHDYASAAAELKVSSSTVIYHMRQIFQKMQVHSKSEAVAKALRDGLLR